MITETDFNETFSHHTADVNGVKLHFVKGGKGEVVVLLHGIPQTWYERHRVMPDRSVGRDFLNGDIQ